VATTELGRIDKTAGTPAGKSGKGRAAKRQRRERAEAQALAYLEDQTKHLESTHPASVENSDVKKVEPVAGQERRVEHRTGTGPVQSHVRTPLAELQSGEKREAATVKGVHAFGAFVDISAEKDGLLPASELQGMEAAVGQTLTVYVKHVNLERGRIALTRTVLRGSRARPPSCRPGDAPRTSNTSSVGESVASKASGRSSSTLSFGSSRTVRADLRLAAIEALAAALDKAPDGVYVHGTVVNRTRCGMFVRLGSCGRELADIMAACLADGLVKISAPAGSVTVDGLLLNSELVAAYDAGIIGSAGAANGVHVGKQVGVYVVEVDVEQQQVRLSLRPKLVKDAAPPSATTPASDEHTECKEPAEVDAATLATRLQWQLQSPTQVEVVPPLIIRTMRRVPAGTFRTIRLVEMAWKQETHFA